MTRKERALALLNSHLKQDYHYLGEGFSGIVFHDGFHVYKVHIPLASDSYGESDGISFLRSKLDVFKESIHFYELEMFEIDGIQVLKYRYDEGETVNRISEKDFIGFLAECWKKKIIPKSITKEKNFIRVNGLLKFIDYEILPYNDNLFLNCAARAFIYLKYPDLSEEQYNRIKRSIINNFDIEELDGFDRFLNKVLNYISFGDESEPNYDSISNSEEIPIETNKQEKSVRNTTLLIKACPQDSDTIYQQVRHIIKQLSSPDGFFEKVIAIDTKEKDFLREFTKEGTLDDLYRELNRLIDEKIIDYFIELPFDRIESTNQNWFGITTNETHTVSNIPVTPQVYAFEQVKGDFILQMDCDVLIGRHDIKHSYLSDMIKALNENENAVSVGFNIPKAQDVGFVDYHAPPGGYKPEVRFCLIHKERLLKSRPWPNELVNDKLKYSWYQSLYNHQKDTGLVSLRGGDSRSYYIHPQNYRKTCKYNLSILMDRIEKNIIPDLQREHFDVEGSLYDWAIPKRSERIVIFSILEKDDGLERFFRFFQSILNQHLDDFGVLIINNDQDPEKDRILWNFLKKQNKVTYIHNKFKMRNTQNIYLGLHYFADNPDSIIVLANVRDYFLGNVAIKEIVERMNIYNADALIGKQINTTHIEDLGLFRVNFMKPRDFNSNIHHNPKAFRKRLFDSLNLYDIKVEKDSTKTSNNFEKMSKKYDWIDDSENSVLFSQIVEISNNPIRFDYINYVIDSREIDENKIKSSLSIIKDKSRKSHKSIIEGNRIDFTPNFNKVEIDITYSCDLKCEGCNRSCTQAPSNDDNMSIAQIKMFIEESISLEKKWELINILGGEPTLHPDFLKIIILILNDYISEFSEDTVLQITSNGYSKRAKELLEQLPKSRNIVIDHYSFKDSKNNIYFTPINRAPIDIIKYKDLDFTKGCWVTSYCGIGLNKYGYYPCGVAGAMDRVMGFDVGIKKLSEITIEKMKVLLDRFCRYCGNMIDYDKNMGNFIPRCERAPFSGNIETQSWEKFYKIYREKRPKLVPIYEHFNE